QVLGAFIGFIILIGFVYFGPFITQSLETNYNTNLNNTEDNFSLPTQDINIYSNPRKAEFEYIINGEHWTLTTTLYKGLSDYLEELPREIYYTPEYENPPTEYDFLMKKLNDEKQKPFLDSFIQFAKDKNISENDKVRLIVNLVQQIPYDYSASDYQVDIGKYPYEVLYKNKGVCGEKAPLLIYFLKELGYGTAYLSFEQEKHAVTGIKCPSQYDYKDSGYCFIESTSPNIITDHYGSYRTVGELKSTPDVIVISDGKTYSGAKEDFENTLRYQELKENHKNSSDYKEWLSLRKKYGLEQKQCDGDALICNGECWTPCEKGHGFYCTTNGAICKK
ncbi:MAG: hypothetical protein PHP82_02095, partial [Candidatus ainarchaeum sp.]|nr:hypothetical protein [Candidatus ainarchaeum sp.]